VLKISKAAIETAPSFSGEKTRLIGRIANLEKQKRLIQLIDPTRLIENQELKSLAALAS
jgi:purine-binding chemotaxis protein CheW